MDKKEKVRLTKAEKSWVMYDVASSAFTMIITTTLPIYFKMFAEGSSIMGADVTGVWGTVTSVSILILALLSPVLGAVADYRGMKKRMFAVAIACGFTSLVWLSLTNSLMVFLVLFVVSRLCYSAGNVFYDSMLTDVSTDERMDSVSATGYAWGYIGSCVPFIAGIAVIMLKPFGMSDRAALQASFLITAAWWLLLSVPLLKNVTHTNYLTRQGGGLLKGAFSRLRVTVKKIASDKKILYFILAYFCYIDGVYTIISMATSYGAEVGIDSIQMILALLVTQFVAFPAVGAVARLSERHDPLKMISALIVAYFAICLFGYQLDKAWEFWVLAVAVGLVMGGIQTLSRSYFARMIPKDESNEYFGFLEIFGRFADFMGPLLLSASAFLFNSSKYGILFLLALFMAGFILLQKARKAAGDS